MSGPGPLSPGSVARNQRRVRWLVLVLSCLLMVGNYYCYDNPSALHDQIKARFEPRLPAGEYEFYASLLYTVYSVPNVVLPFLGGFLVDKVGVRVMIVLFCGLVMTGQCVFALGNSLMNFDVMLLGRVLFGLGGESITVGQSALVAAWFKDKELAMALGINLSVARLGSVANNYLSPILAAKSLDTAIWFGVAVCAMSMATTLVLVCIDRSVDREEEEAAQQHEHHHLHLQAHGGFFETPKFGRKPNADTQALLKQKYDATPRSRKVIEKKIEESEQIRLSDAKHFDASFWLITGCCLAVYGAVLPFNNIASAFLQAKYYFVPLPDGVADVDCSQADQLAAFPDYCHDKDAAEAHAGSVMSIPYTLSAVLSPFLGYAVDRYGERALQIATSPLILVAVHLTMAWSTLEPTWPLFGMGISYSIFAAVIWPAVPCVVEERHVGTAYGVMTSCQNIGMAVIPLLVAYVQSAHGYSGVEVFFAGLAAIGALIGVGLVLMDRRTGGRLAAVTLDPDDAPAPPQRAPDRPTGLPTGRSAQGSKKGKAKTKKGEGVASERTRLMAVP